MKNPDYSSMKIKLVSLFLLSAIPCLALAGSEKWLTYSNTDANRAVFNPSQDNSNKLDTVFASGQMPTGSLRADSGISDTRFSALGISGLSKTELAGVCDRFGVGGTLAVADQVAGQQTVGSESEGLQQVALAVRTDPQAFTHMLSGPVTQVTDLGQMSGISAESGQQENTGLVPMNLLSAVTGVSEQRTEATATTGQFQGPAPSAAVGQLPRQAESAVAKKSAVGLDETTFMLPGQTFGVEGTEVMTALGTSTGDLPKIESRHRGTFTGLRKEVESALDPTSRLRPEVRIHRLEAGLEKAKLAAGSSGGSTQSEKAESRQIVIAEGALYKLYSALDPAAAAAMKVNKEEKLAEIKEDMEAYAAICQDASLNHFISSITSSASQETGAAAGKTGKIQSSADKKSSGAVAGKITLTWAAVSDKLTTFGGKSAVTGIVNRLSDAFKSLLATAAKALRATVTGSDLRASTGLKINDPEAGRSATKTTEGETQQTGAKAAEEVKKASVNGEAFKKFQVNNIVYMKKETLAGVDRLKVTSSTPLQGARLKEKSDQYASQNYQSSDSRVLQNVNAERELNQVQYAGSAAVQQSGAAPMQSSQPAPAADNGLRSAQPDLYSSNPSADMSILRSVDRSTLTQFQAALTAGAGSPEYKKLVEQYQAVLQTIEGNPNDRRALHLALLYAGTIYTLDPDARAESRGELLKTDAATAGSGLRSDSPRMAAVVTAALQGDSAQLSALFNLGAEAVSSNMQGNQATGSEAANLRTGGQAPKVLVGPGSESYAVQGSAVKGFSVKVRLGLSEKTFTLTMASNALVDRWTKAGDPDNALKASPYRDLIAYECLISKDWSAGAKAMVNAYLSANGRPRRAKLGASEL